MFTARLRRRTEGRTDRPAQPGTAPVGSLTPERISASTTPSLILKRSRGDITEIMMTIPGEVKSHPVPTISECSVAQVSEEEERRGERTVSKL